MSILQSLPQWLAAIVAVLGAVASLATALALVVRLVALVPALSAVGKAAPWLDHFAVDVVGLAKKIGGLLGKSAAPVAMLMLGALLGGCSWFSAHEPQVVHGAADLIDCVLQHDKEPISSIASACYGVAEQDVIAILMAHHEAMVRETAGKAACQLPAPPASSVSK